MTGYHLVEWVYGENAGRPGFERNVKAFREALKALPDSPLEDAGKVTNGTKHFAPERINTGKHKGAFDSRVFQRNAFDVSHLWLERTRSSALKTSLTSWSTSGMPSSEHAVSNSMLKRWAGAASNSAVAEPN